ncbi:MAG: tetratricopeptide repeat protein, partial [Cyclobacteriaceae bacterium]|nr:tetratricopeptide repeat protein [Cyclobacteriaceae bacterium]
KEFGKEHPDYATSCNNLALLYAEQGRYNEAELLHKEAKEIRIKVLGKEHLSYSTSCNNLAYLFVKQGRYSEAEPLYKEVKEIRAKVLGKDHPNYVASCNNLAYLYVQQGRFSEAEPLYKEAKEIQAKVLGKEHPDYANSCGSLANLYADQGRYSEAEPLYMEAKEIRAKVLGKEHPDYATSCNNLAYLYAEQGRYNEAEPLFKEAKEIRSRVLGKEHPDYANSCNNLAALYESQGRYSEAEQLYEEAKEIYTRVSGKEHPDYATSCNNLAFLYAEQGRYSEAEQLYKEAKEIYTRVSGKEHPVYATSCNNLAALYKSQGRYSEAETLYKEAKEIRAKVLGKEHPDYATACNNLAVLYKSQGRYSEAEHLYKESQEIVTKVLGKEHPNYASLCNNLADLYKYQGRYSEAETLYKEAKEIRAKVLGKEHPDYATSCNNLAALYQSQGLYSRAEQLLKEAKEIWAKVLGNEHPTFASVCNNLATMYEYQGRYTEAEPLYKEASHTLINNIQRNFAGLSEKEREQYLSTFKDNFESYYSFSLKAQKPELNTWLLENNLITKGLLFFSTNQLRRTLEKSTDKTLKEKYTQWLATRRELSQAYEMGEQKRSEKNINLQEIEKRANEQEKQLYALLAKAGIKAELTPQLHTWKEIQQKLKPHEALVEMTRIEYYNKEWTDSVLYIALIVKKNSTYPEIVVLPEGNSMEKRYIKYYRNAIQFQNTDEQSYQFFFAPISQALGQEVQKVYFSSDGVYHQINLATLYNPKSQKYLSEEMNIQLISTTRDYLRLSEKELKEFNKNYRIALFGYPDFAGKNIGKAFNGEERAIADVTLVQKIGRNQRFLESSGSVSYLPGTKKEIETIQSLAKSSGVNPEVYLSEKAREENLKSVQSPDVLHIATHGFFIESKEIDRNLSTENKRFDNPLQRAGLLLANAELALHEKEVPGKDNGILTAQEAMELDLDDTELVVLSACETGLGEVRNGEGVFGLQRALQQAGAKSIVMSLWKVDDAATQEMMSLFYENLLMKKQDKRTAFHKAQQAMKAKFKSPYYWGAFVMVGE